MTEECIIDKIVRIAEKAEKMTHDVVRIAKTACEIENCVSGYDVSKWKQKETWKASVQCAIMTATKLE